ncbi:DUF1232 domain-containing protein [Candidatus Sumerlaeota bacterium]|nr:DUF1232 domain-containing protein [Candidatus Sumerlaeota bacterium]
MPKTGTIEYTTTEDQSGPHRAKAVVHRSLLQRIGHGYQTFRMMMRDTGYVFPTRLKIAALVLALYIIFPFDVVPDFFPVIGFADDTALLAGIFWMLTNEITSYARQRGRE